MSSTYSSSRYQNLFGIVLVVVIAGVTSIFITLRHGMLIWGKMFYAGWPIFLVAILVGLSWGIVGEKWLKDSKVGRFLFWLMNVVTAILCGNTLARKLDISDTLFFLLFVAIQGGMNVGAGILFGGYFSQADSR